MDSTLSAREKETNQTSVKSSFIVADFRRKDVVPVSSAAANIQWLRWNGCAWKLRGHEMSEKEN